MSLPSCSAGVQRRGQLSSRCALGTGHLSRIRPRDGHALRPGPRAGHIARSARPALVAPLPGSGSSRAARRFTRPPAPFVDCQRRRSGSPLAARPQLASAKPSRWRCGPRRSSACALRMISPPPPSPQYVASPPVIPPRLQRIRRPLPTAPASLSPAAHARSLARKEDRATHTSKEASVACDAPSPYPSPGTGARGQRKS